MQERAQGSSKDAGRSLLDEPRVASALAEGRQAYVAMETSKGPHVTPQLYACAEGRLWFFAASSTLKAKVLRTHPRVSVLVRAGTRVVVCNGEVTALDVAAPGELLDSLPEASAVPKAILDFSLRNAADLAGFAVDAVRGKTGPPVPQRRILFGLRAERAALLEDHEVLDAWGPWPGSADDAACGGVGADGEGPGGGNDEPAPGSTPVGAVVGWETVDDPVALPARWHSEESRGTVPCNLVALAGARDMSRAGLVFDEYGGPGPAAKQGVLLRGDGRIERRGGTWIRIDVERRVRWDGVETDSEDVDGTEASAAASSEIGDAPA